MGNTFVNLPAPSANGAGAWVDVSGQSPDKTLVLGAGLVATVNVEVTNLAAPTANDEGAPVATFLSSDLKQVRVCARWMRAVVSNYKSGTPNCDSSSSGDAVQFVTLDVPAAAGAGAASDVSAQGMYKTVTIQGAYRGGIAIEVSQDGSAWAEIVSFVGENRAGAQMQSFVATARYLRVTRSGTTITGTPTVDVGASSSSPEIISIAPGANKAAEINAAVQSLAALATDTSPRWVQLEAGVYTLETDVDLATNVYVRGVGPQTQIVPLFTGGDDTATNAVFNIVGTLDVATLNTTLSVDASKNSNSISVNAGGSLAASQWLYITGNNGGGATYAGDYGMSDGIDVVLKELIQVASTHVTGATTIPLAWPLGQSHAGPVKATVQAVTPIRNSGVNELYIRGGEGGVTTAVGVYATRSYNIACHGVEASGTTRGILEVVGVKRFNSTDLFSRGNNNSWFMGESIITFDISRWDGLEGADVRRSNAQGIPREQIHLWTRCTDGYVHDGHCVNGTWGVFHGGGVNLRFANIHMRNMEMTDEAYSRWVNGPDGAGATGSFHAMGFSSGNGPLTIAEFAFGTTISNITVEDCRVPNTAFWTASPYVARYHYIHDTMRINVTNLTAMNIGVTQPIAGTVWSDCEGNAANLMVKGCSYGVWTQNVQVDVKFVDYRYDPLNAQANTGIALYLDHNSISSNGPIFKNVQVSSSFAGVFRVGGSFQYDPRFLIENLETDSGKWSTVIMVENATGVNFAPRDIVELDPTYGGLAKRVRTPVVAGTYYSRLFAMCTGAGEDFGTGFMLACELPAAFASVQADVNVVARGDRMVYVATRQAQTGAGASIGTAWTPKAAGAAGAVLVGPTTS